MIPSRSFLWSSVRCGLATILITTAAQAQFDLVGDKSRSALMPIETATENTNNNIAFTLASDAPSIPAAAADKYIIPSTEIGGADVAYPLGEMVQLWIKPIEQKPQFLESVAYSWTVLPGKQVVTWPDSTRILFGTGIKDTTYTVILTASYVYVDPTEDKLQIVQRATTKSVQVKVGDGTIPVDPGNGGNNGGGVDLNGLAKNAYDWTAFVEASPEYSPEAIKQDATVIANNFAQIAAEIESGALTQVTDILQRTKTLNDNGTVNRNAWLPWFNKMSNFIAQSYNEDQSITTPVQFADAWKMISQGLMAASR